MNKDEILAKSRAENKNHDVYELEVTNKGMVLSNISASIFALILFVFQLVFGREVDYGLFSVVYCSFAVTQWYKWGKLKQKHVLWNAALFTLCVLIFTVMFFRNLLA